MTQTAKQKSLIKKYHLEKCKIMLQELFNDFNIIFSNVNNLENVNFNEKMTVRTDLEFIDLCS